MSNPIITNMEDFKDNLNIHGYSYIKEIPENFNYEDFLSRFGTFLPQYDGELVWSIKSKPEFNELYHSLNQKPVDPHTECYEFEGLPNHYQALWCLTPSKDDQGKTMLADFFNFYECLDSEEKNMFRQKYSFVSSEGLQTTNLGKEASHPIVSEYNSQKIVRFSYHCMDFSDYPEVNSLVSRVIDYFNENKTSFTWDKGDLLIWNNWRMLHSRSSFTNPDRELRRVWIK